MSETKFHSCDTCHRAAPADYSFVFPWWSGWIHIGRSHDGLDFCSWACVAAYASEQAGADSVSVAEPRDAVVETIAGLRQQRRHTAKRAAAR